MCKTLVHSVVVISGESAKQDKVQDYLNLLLYMWWLHGMKVIVITRGGLDDTLNRDEFQVRVSHADVWLNIRKPDQIIVPIESTEGIGEGRTRR